MLAAFALLGLCAGCLAGLLGVGGGVILVPLFMWSFNLVGMDQHIVVHAAFATSLAIIIPTAISNTFRHRLRGNVCGQQVMYLAIGAIGGAFMGAWAASLLQGEVLKLAFGLMQLAVAANLMIGNTARPVGEIRDKKILLLLTGLLGGVYSAFFGVGGGVIAVPLMVLLLRFPMHRAIGNSAALIVVSSIVGTSAYIYSGWSLTLLSHGFLGFVFLPAVAMVVPFSLVGSKIGVNLAGNFSHEKLLKVFALMLIIVGLRVIWSTV
jgi:hypothetical protein